MTKRRKLQDDAYIRVGSFEGFDTSSTSACTLSTVDTSAVLSNLGASTSWRSNSQATLSSIQSGPGAIVSSSLLSYPGEIRQNIFCSLPTEVLEIIFSYLSIPDRLGFFQALKGKYLNDKARQALSSVSLWRNVRLISRRPDHLVTRHPLPSDLLVSAQIPMKDKEQLLRFFPIHSKSCMTRLVDLSVYMFQKHTFSIPFDFVLSAIVLRRNCPGIRSFYFSVEEIWDPGYYPLRRSDVALDRIAQIIDGLCNKCKEINLVKWPRLQDDTIIDDTYSEMQAHYASSELSSTDPVLSIMSNGMLLQNLEVFGLFWFDFEDPEFWSIARSEWCLMSHQWAWSEEEFASGHTLYPTQAHREFLAVDSLVSLQELRLTFSHYSDDRYFLDPTISPLATRQTLKVLQIAIRSSWSGWDGMNPFRDPVADYWKGVVKLLPELKVVLTFLEFFDYLKLSDIRHLFHPHVPVHKIQWLPAAVVTLHALQCATFAYRTTLTCLDLHTDLVDHEGRNNGLALLADVICLIRDCPVLTHLTFDSTVTLHFVNILMRTKRHHWQRVVLFGDKLRGCVRQQAIDAFQDGMAKIIGRDWRFHDKKDRERGPRFYRG